MLFYFINNLLKKSGFKIPAGANFNNEFKNMYAEEIYDILKEKRPNEFLFRVHNESSLKSSLSLVKILAQ